MKNKLLKYLPIIILLFTFYFIITNNTIIRRNIILAINLWLTKIIPSIFPMIIINELLIYFDFPILFYKLFSKLKINKNIIYIFIMSIFSGTPTNAKIIKSLYDNQQIKIEDANIALTFSFFPNPLFLLNMLNKTFNYYITLKIIIANYLANLIIFIIFYKKLSNYIIYDYLNNIKELINNKINKTIKESINTLLMVLGNIIYYIMLSTIIVNTLNLNNLFNTLITGFIEITQGLNNLNSFNTTLIYKEIIAISIISFGGISIHSQIKCIFDNIKINYNYLYIGRMLNLILSILLFFMINTVLF